MADPGTDATRVLLLGPVEVRHRAGTLPVGPARRRGVLAALAWQPRRVITLDTLSWRVWGDEPPPAAREALYSHISRLRALFAAGGEVDAIRREAGGYTLRLADDAVDTLTFDRLVVSARSASMRGDERLAVDRYREALALRRGEPLSGLPGPWAEHCAASLTERFWTAVEDLAECRLRLADHAAVIQDLSSYAAERPDRERMAGQLMVALYRLGRPAAAMEVYERTRRVLADRYGMPPGARLAELATSVAHDSAPGPTPTARTRTTVTVASRSARPVPRELPAPVTGFVGRSAQLSELDEQIGTVPAVAIVGSAGVGKTELALHWGHRVAESFPDGQLYVDLRGFTPDAVPLAPAPVLARFLRSLVAPEAVIADEDELAATFRSALAGRRVLLILDNAAGPAQVLPLLPADPGSLAVITSRRTLDGLTARVAATRLSLGRLAETDAWDLVRHTVGASRVDCEPESARRIVDLCARLPLALRIVGAHVAGRPYEPLAAAVDRLSTEDRFDSLAAGDDARFAVAASFDASYAALPEPARYLFRSLAAFPGPEFDAQTALHLTSWGEPGRVEGPLSTLAEAHLVEPTGNGTYRIHDLLRLYARRRAATEGPDGRAAAGRLYTFYRHAIQQISGDDLPGMALDPTHPVLPSDQSTVDWLVRHTPNLLAAARDAAGSDLAAEGWRLVYALRSHLLHRRPVAELLDVAQWGLDAAQRADEPLGILAMHRILSRARLRLGHDDAAVHHAHLALDSARGLGDPLAEVGSRHTLAMAYLRQRRPAEATAHLTAALAQCADLPEILVGIHNLLASRRKPTTGQRRRSNII